MSFHGFSEMAARLAWVTIDPSGSRRSNRRCAESTTSKRPSGRKSMHIGNDATWAMTSWPPLGSSAIT
jgi:predicted NBD/HSP70 family sugar kinase